MSARVLIPLLLLLPACGVHVPASAATTAVICSPFVPHTRSVGNTATDASCTDNTIQAAIDNAVCPNTTIFVTRERSYGAQHLTIQNKTLTLAGTSATCGGVGSTGSTAPGSTPTAPIVTLDGSGNGGASVLVVRGNSNVNLQFLHLTHGAGGSGSHGGGIDFQGAGSLTLDTSTIDLNGANFGGGIEFSGVGGAATLTLKSYTIVESNTASGNGGGINLEGTATLVANQPFTLIGFNHAPNGKGGGIAVVGPAVADIGSPGYGGLPVIEGNVAANGGGMSLQAIDTGAATANLYATDANHPIGIGDNFASQRGGGAYLVPFASFSIWNDATLCARNFHVDGNAAPDGAALYADSVSVLGASMPGGLIALNERTTETCAAIPGSVACAAGVACNTIDQNESVDSTNRPTAGATVYSEGQLDLSRIAMRDNSGGHAIRQTAGGIALHECLIADNSYSAEMIRLEGDGSSAADSRIDNCTIVNNAHNSGSILHLEYDLILSRSILDQPAMSSLNVGGTPAITAEYLLAADPTGLPSGMHIVQGEPTYVDAAHGNYHQLVSIVGTRVVASPGIDFAPLLAGDLIDLDGNPRDVDLPGVPNIAGTHDLGAYEEQSIPARVAVATSLPAH